MYVKGYALFSLTKNASKKIGKNISSKYSQKGIGSAKICDRYT